IQRRSGRRKHRIQFRRTPADALRTDRAGPAAGSARWVCRRDRIFCRLLYLRASTRAMPAAGFGECGGVDANAAYGARKERKEDRMFEPGVMFWAERDNLEMVRSLGVRYGQLGI